MVALLKHESFFHCLNEWAWSERPFVKPNVARQKTVTYFTLQLSHIHIYLNYDMNIANNKIKNNEKIKKKKSRRIKKNEKNVKLKTEKM